MQKIKQKAIFVSNINKVDGAIDLNEQLELGYLVKSFIQYPELDECYGGVIYILEKNEEICSSN